MWWVLASCGRGPSGPPEGCLALEAPDWDPAPPADERFVSRAGDDAGDGTSDHPWATLGAAIDRLAPGETLVVGPGEWDERLVVRSSGSPDAPLAVRGDPEDPPTVPTIEIYGSHVIVQDLVVRPRSPQDDQEHGVYVNGAHWEPPGAHHVVLRGLDVAGSHMQGIMLSGDHTLVEGCDVWNNGVHENFDHGLYVEGACEVIRDNTFADNHAFGIHLYRGAEGDAGYSLVERNLVVGNGFGSAAEVPRVETAGIIVASHQPGVVVRDNVTCGNAKSGILVIDSVATAALEDNLSCDNGEVGFDVSRAAGGTTWSGLVSVDDGVALSTRSDLAGGDDVWWASSGAPRFRLDDAPATFAALQSAGLEQGSVVDDPGLTLPAAPVDWWAVDWCAALPSWCP